MNLTDARAFARQFARNANDSSMYADADVDRAIQAVADDFINVTRATVQLDDLAITAAVSAVGALPTGFRPERIVRAWIPTFGILELVDHGHIVELQIDQPQTALPTMLAFSSWTSGEVYPTPDVNHTAKIQWTMPFTTWTVGAAVNPTLNLPDDWLRLIIAYGTTATLQHNEPEHKYASVSWQKYTQFRDGLRGAGGLGARSAHRNRGS